MLSKIEGARRIMYNRYEYYVLPGSLARHHFDNIKDWAESDDTLIVVGNEDGRYAFDVAASSSKLDERNFSIEAIYHTGGREIRIPYTFPSYAVAIAELIINDSEITSGDNKDYRHSDSIEEYFLNILYVATAAYEHLTVKTLLDIVSYGMPTYSEAVGSKYVETKQLTQWGLGEEGRSGVIVDEYDDEMTIPDTIEIKHNNAEVLKMALDDPRWQNVKYIKLIKGTLN
jgi:hypothetical protein